MEIKVSLNNEFEFIPDIENNRELDAPWTIVIKRVNRSLSAGQWASLTDDGQVAVSIAAKIKTHIVEMKNSPILVNGDMREELTVDVLLSDKYKELYDVVDQLHVFISDLESDSLDIKK